MRLRTQVLILQLAVLAVSLGVGFGVVISSTDDRVRDEYAERALAIAQSVAADNDIRSAVAVEQGTTLDGRVLARGPIQQQANAVRQRTGALFVVIANRGGIRLAHPENDELGRHVSTDPTRALAGSVDLTTDRGTLGDSVRAKVPIFDAAGRVVGLVSVGVSTQRSDAETRHSIATLIGIALAALAVGGVGSLLLARRWQRLTLGLQPDELAELVREQRAVLHAMADGVLAVDADGVVRVVNNKARQLLDITAPTGTAATDIGLTPRVAAVLAEPTDDAVAATVGDRVVLVSSHRAHADGRDLGMVLSVIDRTDVERLTREVDSIRSMSSALRAQRHETANRMHVLAGLLRHGHPEDALAYLDELTGVSGGRAQLDGLQNVEEPHLHAFLDAKAAVARERGVTLRLGAQTWVVGTLTEPVVVTTVVGNLVDNAIDAAAENADAPGEVEVDLMTDGDTLLVTVADTGRGITYADPSSIFHEGVTGKPDSGVPGGRGMGLSIARQLARRIGGDIRVVDVGGSVGESGSGAVFVATLPGVLGGVDDVDTNDEPLAGRALPVDRVASERGEEAYRDPGASR